MLCDFCSFLSRELFCEEERLLVMCCLFEFNLKGMVLNKVICAINEKLLQQRNSYV